MKTNPKPAANALDEETVERLIRISKEKPLLPETFVPWADDPELAERFLPDILVSLTGHPLADTLTPAQVRELGRLEVSQVMYSYAWSETLACLFFNRHMLTLEPDSGEYRFLIRESIEEFRHQEMFAEAVRRLGRGAAKPSGQHRFWGNITARFLPAPQVFMSVLAVELMADIYAHHIRRDEGCYSVLRKCSELHHIEEGRHIFYTKLWLRRYTDGAGFITRTRFSLIILLNLYFMRTLYVRKSFFERIGAPDPAACYKAARSHFKAKFGAHCLDEAVAFVDGFGGFNFITRPLWRRLAGARV